MADNDDAVVQYTTKELFQQVNDKMDKVIAVLPEKVDQMDFEELQKTVQNHEVRITANESNDSFKRYFIAALVIPSISILIAGVGLIIKFK